MLRINTCNNSNRLTSLIGPHRGKWGHWPQQRGFGVLLGFRHHLDFLLYMLAINVLSAKTSLLAVVLHLKIIGRLLFPAKVGRGSSWSTRRQCAIIDARYQFYSVDVAHFSRSFTTTKAGLRTWRCIISQLRSHQPNWASGLVCSRVFCYPFLPALLSHISVDSPTLSIFYFGLDRSWLFNAAGFLAK